MSVLHIAEHEDSFSSLSNVHECLGGFRMVLSCLRQADNHQIIDTQLEGLGIDVATFSDTWRSKTFIDEYGIFLLTWNRLPLHGYLSPLTATSIKLLVVLTSW